MKGKPMAVTRIGSENPNDCISYVVSGEEAKQLEHYLFERSKDELEAEKRKNDELWKKSEQKRKAILEL